ncbi:hypothetical protein ICW40_04265 [Actinotalea ferrariae]|nr:hypothetical protein [Actinotalea ferrariae]
MRLEIATAVASLSDLEYQQRVWVGKEWPVEEYYDNVERTIQWLCEETPALGEPETLVGSMLFAEEVLPMSALAAQLAPIIEDLGAAPDEAYLNDPRWPGVVAAAARMRELLEKNGGFPMPARGLAPLPPAQP